MLWSKQCGLNLVHTENNLHLGPNISFIFNFQQQQQLEPWYGCTRQFNKVSCMQMSSVATNNGSKDCFFSAYCYCEWFHCSVWFVSAHIQGYNKKKCLEERVCISINFSCIDNHLSSSWYDPLFTAAIHWQKTKYRMFIFSSKKTNFYKKYILFVIRFSNSRASCAASQ